MLPLRSRAPSPIVVTSAIVLAATVACSSGTTDPPPADTTPASINVVSGNGQSAQVSTALGSPLVVKVANAAGDALSAVTVDWTMQAGGGTVGSASSTTNTQGQAQTTYTLGASAGANTIRATVNGTSLGATFTATATAAPTDTVPAAIAIVSGNNQSAGLNSALAQPLVVVVRNASAQALVNVAVSWTLTGGGGSLGSASSTTNGAGQASNTFTNGSSAGSSTIEAAVQSNTAIKTSFTANAVAGGTVSVADNSFSPASLTINSGATVTWNWTGSNPHNVTWVSASFANSSTQSSGSHAVTFNSTGTFDYYCTIHGSPTGGMRGSVTVQYRRSPNPAAARRDPPVAPLPTPPPKGHHR